MTATRTHHPVPFTTQSPTVVGPLAVFPLLADRAPTFRYLGFAEAVTHGAAVTELPDGASVNDVLVNNPLIVPVLLYEGQELLGAQQNRTLDASVLVAPRSKLSVPVSCVEAGRWDQTRSDEPFAPSPQAAHPRMRRMKSVHARASARTGATPRAIQSEVWQEVDATATRHRTASTTRAMHDVFEHRRSRLTEMTSEIERQPDQVGTLVAIGGRFVVLDYVSEAEAFATLHGPLLQGYALDALDEPTVEPPSVADAQDFAELLMQAPRRPSKAVGVGEGVSIDFGRLTASGLVHEEEMVTLTAFAQS